MSKTQLTTEIIITAVNYLIARHKANSPQRNIIARKIDRGDPVTRKDLGLEKELDDVLAEGDALNPQESDSE